MADINVTPLIDVLLVLLMVFMLAAPILAHRVELTLPQPNRDPPPPNRVITLLLHADGRIAYDGSVIPDAALDPQLRYDLGKNPKLTVSVDAESSVHYEDFARTVALLQRIGVHDIGVARFPTR
jgi:biopolymer transport protein ExbD